MTDDVEQVKQDEAIRRVIEEGGVLDYLDVVEEVNKRYGMSVGSTAVEKVHAAMKQEAEMLQQVARQQDPGSSTNAEIEKTAKVLRFVKDMGGLDEARDAIADLEAQMLELVK